MRIAPMLLLGLCLIAALPALPRGRFRRWQGMALPGVYGAYVAAVIWP